VTDLNFPLAFLTILSLCFAMYALHEATKWKARAWLEREMKELKKSEAEKMEEKLDRIREILDEDEE